MITRNNDSPKEQFIGFNVNIMILTLLTGGVFLNILCLVLWYGVRHLDIEYKILMYGVSGENTCNIGLNLDYGEGASKRKDLGAFVTFNHVFTLNTPRLFVGKEIFAPYQLRSDKFKEIYQPLYDYEPRLCQEITMAADISIKKHESAYDRILPNSSKTWTKTSISLSHQYEVRNIKRNEVIAKLTAYINRLPGKCNICEEQIKGDEYNGKNFQQTLYLDLTPKNFISKIIFKGDLSKLDCTAKFKLPYGMRCDTIMFDAIGPFSMFNANIAPDSLSYSKVFFFDPTKIARIIKNDLQFYAEFPKTKKYQDFRIALALVLLPILLGNVWLQLTKIYRLVQIHTLKLVQFIH